MTELGHAVYYVRKLEASLKFYNAAVGLEVSGKIFNGRAALLTGGRTHTTSQRIYLRDPDGNEVKLFVYNPDSDWESDTSWMAALVKPLVL